MFSHIHLTVLIALALCVTLCHWYIRGMTSTQHTTKHMHTTAAILYTIALVMAYHQGGMGMAIYLSVAVVVAYITLRLQDGV